MNSLYKKISFWLFIVLFSTIELNAQAPDTAWTRWYGGTGYDDGCSVQQTTDGGYIIIGYTESFGNNEDIYLIKTDINGDTIWTRTYGGSGNDEGYSVVQTLDNGYTFVGITDIYDADGDVYLLKIDANGDTIWTKIYGGASAEVGFMIQQTADSGYIIVGQTESFGSNGDVYLIKTDSNGDTAWTRHYGRTGVDFGSCVQEIAGGNYIIAGTSENVSTTMSDVYIIKANADGDTLWTKTYGSPLDEDWALSIQQSFDQGFIIGGWTYPYTTMNADFYILRTNADGDTLWTKKYGGVYDDFCRSLSITADSGYIFTGFTYSFGAGECDVYLLRTDENGDSLWTRTYGGTSFDAGASVKQTSDHGYIITGFTDSFGSNGDVYLIKINPELNILENTRTNPRNKKSFLSVTPNPFRSNVNIRLHTPDKQDITLKIYDALGRVVKTLSAKPNTDITWDGSDNLEQQLNTGVYFIRFEYQNQIETEKILLMR